MKEISYQIIRKEAEQSETSTTLSSDIQNE